MKKSSLTRFVALLTAAGICAGLGFSASAVTFPANGTDNNGGALQTTVTYQSLAGTGNGIGNGNLPVNGAVLDGVPDGLANSLNGSSFEDIAVLTLSGWTGNLCPIADISFQCDTNATDANLVPTPEPTTAVCILIGLGVLVFTRRIQNERTWSRSFHLARK